MDAPGTRERGEDAVAPSPAASPAASAPASAPAPPPPPAPGGPARDPFGAADATVEDSEDRWAWRRTIKADPTLRRVYRGLVGFVGVALMVLAASIGWLPGPAGIPLFLLGLAVLASEFAWAHRLLERAKVEARKIEVRARRQPRWVKWLGGLATATGVVAFCWAYLALLGVPGWFPDSVADPLLRLPAVDPSG